MPKILIDGIELKTESKMEKNRLLVPIREYSNLSGGSVLWNQKAKSITITKDDKRIYLVANQNVGYVNGVKKSFDVPVRIYNGVSFIPLRFVSESMDALISGNNQIVYVQYPSKKPKEAYDVVVVGTDPEGISAAIAAAREGQQTLLIDNRNKIGGLFTIGELNSLDMSYTPYPNRRLLTKGIYEEFFNANHKRTSFDTKEAEKVFNEMIKKERNITLVLNASKIKPVIQGSKITHVSFIDKNGISQKYAGKQFIDSTQNADFAYDAGEEFTFGQEDYRNIPEAMSVTQVFELKGVNWNAVKEYLGNDGLNGTGYDAHSAWGFLEMFTYQSSQPDVKMRGLNIGLQNDGSILINALQVLNVKGTDPYQIEQAKQKAAKELPLIVKFMREKLAGFEKAQLSRTASELYIRETRHLKGQYRLTVDDVLENRDFPDKVAFGSYAIDVQTSETQGGFVVGDPAQYSIPYRSIVPKKMTNLLVASRSASYDSLAHGSARVVPVGMVLGEAAGIASAYSNRTKVDFITMAQDKTFQHVKNVQKIMNAKGAELNPIPYYENPVMKNWSYEGIKYLRKYGLVNGSYENDYQTEAAARKKDIMYLINGINERTLANVEVVYPFEWSLDSLTKEELFQLLEGNQIAVESLSSETQKKIENATVITKDIMYMVVAEWFKGIHEAKSVS